MSLATDQPGSVDVDALTAREREVVALLMTGCATDAAIAERLVIACSTVKFHVRGAMRKLDVHTRAQVVSFAYQHGSLVEAETSVPRWQPTI